MSALRTWWSGREPRERQVLAVGALAVLLMLLWAFAYKPLTDARAALHEGNARLAADLQLMRATVARGSAAAINVAGGDDAARRRSGRSLLALVDADLRELGLGPSLKRIEPAGERRVRARLEAVPFDQVVDWLERLSAEQGIRVAEFAGSRTEYAGQADIQMLIEDP